MRLENQDVVQFLSGHNTVRDGYLVGLSVREVEWQTVVALSFHVPNGSEGNCYDLKLSGDVKFDYNFSNESTPEQIGFVKCLWTADGGFYLSLDPWMESERFISDQDCDWFKSKSAVLTVENRERWVTKIR
jgi:hypothetical protein